MPIDSATADVGGHAKVAEGIDQSLPKVLSVIDRAKQLSGGGELSEAAGAAIFGSITIAYPILTIIVVWGLARVMVRSQTLVAAPGKWDALAVAQVGRRDSGGGVPCPEIGTLAVSSFRARRRLACPGARSKRFSNVALRGIRPIIALFHCCRVSRKIEMNDSEV